MFWFNKKDKIALDTAVRAAGRAATEVIVEKAVPEGHLFSATATHFGGNPYFEPGDTWPIFDEARSTYDFVCQVNLKDCAVRPNVVFDLFTVFLCWEAVEEGPDFERACIVRIYRDVSPAKAVSIPRPTRQGRNDYRVRPCTVRTGTFMTYPWKMEGFPAIVAAASRFKDPIAAYAASLKRLGCLHDFRSRVGGFPNWVHDDTLDQDEYVFLAQIAYEHKANNCIGDAAPIFIAVSADDPTRIETDVFQTF